MLVAGEHEVDSEPLCGVGNVNTPIHVTACRELRLLFTSIGQQACDHPGANLHEPGFQ